MRKTRARFIFALLVHVPLYYESLAQASLAPLAVFFFAVSLLQIVQLREQTVCLKFQTRK